MAVKKPIKEQKIQKEIITYLESLGAVVVKINNTPIFSNGRFIPPRQKGISDLLVCYKGYFIAFEVKVKGRPISVEQKAFLERVRNNGGFSGVVYSITDVLNIIEGI